MPIEEFDLYGEIQQLTAQDKSIAMDLAKNVLNKITDELAKAVDLIDGAPGMTAMIIGYVMISFTGNCAQAMQAANGRMNTENVADRIAMTEALVSFMNTKIVDEAKMRLAKLAADSCPNCGLPKKVCSALTAYQMATEAYKRGATVEGRDLAERGEKFFEAFVKARTSLSDKVLNG